MSRIYVASSWKNMITLDPVIEALRTAGHDIYDFREDAGFHWSEVMPDYQKMDLYYSTFEEMLQHPRAKQGFLRDMEHLFWCDILVCALPCGRSAHLELGWAVGAKKRTAVFLGEFPVQPELMYNMVNLVTGSLDRLVTWTREPEQTILHVESAPFIFCEKCGGLYSAEAPEQGGTCTCPERKVA